MQLPRFRIRTLMIVVAVVALDLYSSPGSFLTVLPHGPIGGVIWALGGPSGSKYKFLNSSLQGAVIQAVPLTVVVVGWLAIERVSGLSRIGNEWTTIVLAFWVIPLSSLAYGCVVGLTAELLRPLLRPFGRIVSLGP